MRSTVLSCPTSVTSEVSEWEPQAGEDIEHAHHEERRIGDGRAQPDVGAR